MMRTEGTRFFMYRAYPGYADAIERGLREDPAFRDLCDDFRRCAVALKDLRGQKGEYQVARVAEYEQLLSELAGDVESWLTAVSGGGDMPGGSGAT